MKAFGGCFNGPFAQAKARAGNVRSRARNETSVTFFFRRDEIFFKERKASAF